MPSHAERIAPAAAGRHGRHAMLALLGLVAACTTTPRAIEVQLERAVAKSSAIDWRQCAEAAIDDGNFVHAKALYLDALLRTQDPLRRAALGKQLAAVADREAESDIAYHATFAPRHRELPSASMPAIAAR